MKKTLLLIFSLTTFLVAFGINGVVSDSTSGKKQRGIQVDHRVNSISYWMDLAKKGLVPYNPGVPLKKAVYQGTTIRATTALTEDSPDVPVTEINSTQSENSIFVDPNDNTIVLNSNNSSSWPVSSIYGADYWYSFDSGQNFDGSIQGRGVTTVETPPRPSEPTADGISDTFPTMAVREFPIPMIRDKAGPKKP